MNFFGMIYAVTGKAPDELIDEIKQFNEENPDLDVSRIFEEITEKDIKNETKD